ncbi:hypothetical protein [Dongia sp.]|uniref:hypothetical protein n=1 Tax=Dongia sp. TaxID=1977262 RepID=UPI0035B182DD
MMVMLEAVRRLRHSTLNIVLAFALAACASSPDASKSKAALPTSQDLWRMSGTQDAVLALYQALSDACQVAVQQPDDFLKLAPNEAFCIRSTLVSAFEVGEGAEYCTRNRDLKQFVSCILEGQFVGRVVGNSGSPPLPPDVQWGNRGERGQQANDLLNQKIDAACMTPSKPEMQACVEESMLRYFEIGPQAIAFCPTDEQRSACIYWAGFARSIRVRLDRIAS